MISIDQVLLLEERVESAVKKIEQLNAENAALRSKCAELSNALNAKSEQFSSFQNDQSKIEEGILKALSRLNAVENVVLQAANPAPAQGSFSTSSSEPVIKETPSIPEANQNPISNSIQNSEPSFDTMNASGSNDQPQLEPSAPDMPAEIEVPVENSVQPEPSDSVTPEIDFEFEGADSSETGPEPQQADPKQPMFDIF